MSFEMQIDRSEYRWVKFGTQRQIKEFLTKKIEGEFNPQAKETIQNIINEIASAFHRRNVVAHTGQHIFRAPVLTEGLEKRISRTVQKECLKKGTEKKRGDIFREVSMSLRFYMNHLPLSKLASHSSSSSKERTAKVLQDLNDGEEDFWSLYWATTKTLPYPTGQYVSKLATVVPADYPELQDKIPFGYQIKNGRLSMIGEEDGEGEKSAIEKT